MEGSGGHAPKVGMMRGMRRSWASGVGAGLGWCLGLVLAWGVAWGDDGPGSGLSRAAERLKADVSFLADDAREGREPGSRGIEAAADHIAGVFRESGLKPAPGADGYFQHFTISGVPKIKGQQLLAFRGSDGKTVAAALDHDYRPLAIGAAGRLQGLKVAFAGYGITARDTATGLDYDDYAGLDVKDHAVLIIRREPQLNDPKSLFDGDKTSRFATFRHKATNAFQHGAKAMLIVNDQASITHDEDTLLRFLASGPELISNLPIVMLTRAFAGKLLEAGGCDALEALEKGIDGDLKPRSRKLKGVELDLAVGIDRETVATKNVVGVLEGSGPHAQETVVIGGHYDHLGHGGLMSGSLAVFSRDIHNGADDNASGTSMVLELARRIGKRQDPPPRRVVFMAFSGEEKGLLGSQYYVEHPLFPLESTVMMINCDMVGRLNNKNELTMIGTGTSPGLKELVDVLGKSAGLSIKQVSGITDGFGGSDHQSFYAKKIPVLFAFTGLHKDYHRPSDDANLINYAGMSRIADYLELLALDVIRRPERPAYVQIAAARRAQRSTEATDPARSGSGVYMGTMPDYSDESTDGLKLADVSPGGPAQKAGLKGGDKIIKFGGKPVGTIYDFMESMGRYKPGDKVDVVVQRGDKEITLSVTLGRRPG